ncbi:glycosyltransferase [Synechococcus sp. BMK-MC-1]|uniref:CgeB family protein n=1 Tax=Synechococcus sp. BMK-MC-1 TaxID=1442551 RepID=UPI001CA3BC49|nr:glycosyltransferase [Synechococcus sp. BMK-MC-1]
MRRLGCEVVVLDPAFLLGPLTRFEAFLHYRTAYFFLQKRLLRCIKLSSEFHALSVDLVWVDSGELIGPRILNYFRQYISCPYVLYNSDDPSGARDGVRFSSLRSALSLYSLCVFLRPETSLDALALGARRVLTVHFSYGENLHFPFQSEKNQDLIPVVSFVGANIPGEFRDFFLQQLIHAGIPIRLIGNHWSKSRYWNELKRVYKGPSLSGEAYSEALGNAAVTLGFLSHGNRDLVTRRSFETTACGGLFCAERTSVHQLLYEDGYEAVFWDSVDECILKCKTLLNKLEKRNSICRNGSIRVKELGAGNEDVCRQILASI